MSKLSPAKYSVILFDLDGTLIDTALDFIQVINAMRQEKGMIACEVKEVRKHVSGGYKHLVGHFLCPGQSLGDIPDSEFERFLDRYEDEINRHSILFDGVEQLVGELKGVVSWGVVTNKKRLYTEQVLAGFDVFKQASVVICGDDALKPKPAPDTILKALAQLNCRPSEALYVGDDERDYIAAQQAGVHSVAAMWCGINPPVHLATYHCAKPMGIIDLLCG